MVSKFNHSAKWEQREQRRRERESLAGMKVDALKFGGLVRTLLKSDVESERRGAEIVILSLAARQLRGDFCSPAVTSTAVLKDDILKTASIMMENSNRRAAVLEKAFQGQLDQEEAELFLERDEIDRLKSMTDELNLIVAEISSKFEGKLPDVVTTVGVYPNGPSNTNGVELKDLPYHIWYNLNWRPGRALIVNGKIWYKGSGVTEEKLDSEVAEYSGLVYLIATAPYH